MKIAKIFFTILLFVIASFILQAQNYTNPDAKITMVPPKIYQNIFEKGIYGTSSFNILVSNLRKDIGGQFDIGYQFFPHLYVGSGISLDVMDYTAVQGYATTHLHIDKGAEITPYLFVNFGYNMKVSFDNDNYKESKGGVVYGAGVGIKKTVIERYAVCYYLGFKKTNISYSYDSYYNYETLVKRNIFRIYFGLGFQF